MKVDADYSIDDDLAEAISRVAEGLSQFFTTPEREIIKNALLDACKRNRRSGIDAGADQLKDFIFLGKVILEIAQKRRKAK